MRFWFTYSGRVSGLELKGDPNVPPTTRWNAFYLRTFVWRTVTVLEVPLNVAAYRVGFIPQDGVARRRTGVLHSRRFAVRHGREDCTFFAVMLDGTELPLTIIRRTDIGLMPEGVTLV